MAAYYNEFDKNAAAWLRELIKVGAIADGVVDDRSIVDVEPNDLRDFTQCHFFAGIGVWSYALRQAGWSDDRPVWTGSCPCQPFSAAGKSLGFDDERHLWPHWHHLIRERRPPVILGEQVASKDGLGWLDLVQADMEGEGYAIGAADLCAAGVGAPHIRQRLWFVAKSLADPTSLGERADQPRRDRSDGQFVARAEPGRNGSDDGADGLVEHATGDGRIERRAEPSGRGFASGRGLGGLANSSSTGLPARERETVLGAGWREEGRATEQRSSSSTGGVGDTDRNGRAAAPIGELCSDAEHDLESLLGLGGLADASMRGQSGGLRERGQTERAEGATGGHGAVGSEQPGPVNGYWRNADWLFCRDGKWRPVEPGTFPLAHGAPARVGRLRGYGNAINAKAAEVFIAACKDILDAA